MRKKISVFFIFVLLICTSGCVTFHENFKRADIVENILYIEVYFIEFSYESYNQNIPDSLEPITTIEENLHNEVIEDLESLDYKSTFLIFAASDPNFNLYGFIIKIVYDSGIYQLVGNSGMVYTYDNDEYVSSIEGIVEDKIWNDIIIKYLGKDIFEQYKLPF